MGGVEGGSRRSLANASAVPTGLPGPAFRRREVTVPAGHGLAYEAADWRGALVIVERGEIELHCTRGGHRRFGSGTVLWFDGLGLRALHNPGPEDVMVVALSRCSATANGAPPARGGQQRLT